MPVLHEYSDSYEKSGYYVKVNWSAPHPYPLQTPSITEEIYLELGFQDGDQIPNKLTTQLFKAGLHWTEGNGPSNPQEPSAEEFTTADLPKLTNEQLDRMYELLDNAEAQLGVDDIDPDVLDELKEEITKHPKYTGTERGASSSSVPEETKSIVRELQSEDIETEEIAEIRSKAANKHEFDRSIEQFVRHHPITPRDFEVNPHGDPTFTFRTDSVEWKLADCRHKDLPFDWPVTVGSNTGRGFGIRVSSDELIRIANNGSEISEEQTMDLITIIPCLLWTLDSLDQYHILNWEASPIEDDIPSAMSKQLLTRTNSANEAITQKTTTAEGKVVDLPDHEFARIRTPEDSIVCTAAAALPEDLHVGMTVTFDIEQRYGVDYATDVTIQDDVAFPRSNFDPLRNELTARLSRGFADGDLPDSLGPANAEELDVSIEQTPSVGENQSLRVAISYSTEPNLKELFGYFIIEVSVSEESGLDSIKINTDIEMSWKITGQIHELIAGYMPILATALEHHDIDSGSYYDSPSVQIEPL